MPGLRVARYSSGLDMFNSTLAGLVNWFAGDGKYHDLVHCMAGDYLWVGITIALDLAVACGYALIALHWWRNARMVGNSPSKRALASMRNIFVFCGICGYLFIPIKMYWPAWRLYDVFMAFLVYFTWKYAWGAKDLKVVYNALERSDALARELAESREEARRKAFFLNAVSHDLRTPLNGLMLQAELAELAIGSSDEATLKDALNEIKASAKATAALLAKFLELGRLESAPDENRFETIALEELICSVIKLTAVDAEASGLSIAQRGATDVAVVTDRLKLERILQNLVSNAVKFTKQGGVEVVTSVRGSDVEIAVVDTGVGIASDDLQRLFQEFFQAHNHERDRRKGFGLGLAITRRLALQLGGDVAVTSELGVGSRFTVRLPGALATANAIGGAGRGNAVGQQSTSGAVVLNA